ncbi:MAG: ArsC/Spx/MgsR family protein [Bacteroidia bacterium]
MKLRNNHLMIYYDPSSSLGRKTLAYAHTLTRHVQAVEYHKNPFTGRIWKDLLFMLQLQPKELLNKAHPLYQQKVRGWEVQEDDWLNVLIHNPDLIKGPIVVKGEKAILCSSPTDVLKLANA